MITPVRLFLALALSLFAFVTAGNAATITVGGIQFTEADGTTPISNDFVWYFVADVDGDGFDSTPTPGDFLGGSDDDIIVLEGLHLSMNLGGSGSIGEILSFDAAAPPAGVTPGTTEIQIVWFSTIDSTADTPAAGDFYGTYRTDDVLDGSTRDFTFPEDNIETLSMVTQNMGGSIPNDTLSANQIVIPEPSATLLAGLGFFAFFMRRRRTPGITC